MNEMDIKKFYEHRILLHGTGLSAMGYNRFDCFRAYQVLREAGIQSGDTLLDFGCGSGASTLFFSDCRITGYDVSPTFIRTAKETHADAGARFYQGGLSAAIKHTYDWALCSGTFSVGYETLGEVEEALEKLLGVVHRGVLLSFSRLEDASVRRFALSSWTATAERLTDHFVLRTDFSSRVGALYLYANREIVDPATSRRG